MARCPDCGVYFPQTFGPHPTWVRCGIDERLTVEPDHLARRRDPDTSKLSARQLSALRSNSIRARLLKVYAELTFGTRDEAADAAGVEDYEASKRVSDLLNLNLLYDSGIRRPGRSGRQQRVLGITVAGRQLAEAVDAKTRTV